MKYLIKDLENITGLSAARIRKWQERYRLLRPSVGDNGYHYYTNDDLLILRNIQLRLQKGEKLAKVVTLDRDQLIQYQEGQIFDESKLKLVNHISQGKFDELKKYLDKKYLKKSFSEWLSSDLAGLLQLVGRAWEYGYISIGDEHALSRWLLFYLHRKMKSTSFPDNPVWLVAVFPGDTHEIGAMLHYARLLSLGVPARFCGNLPEDELCKEITRGNFTKLSLSSVVPRKSKEYALLKDRLKKKFPKLNIIMGGSGYRQRKDKH